MHHLCLDVLARVRLWHAPHVVADSLDIRVVGVIGATSAAASPTAEADRGIEICGDLIAVMHHGELPFQGRPFALLCLPLWSAGHACPAALRVKGARPPLHPFPLSRGGAVRKHRSGPCKPAELWQIRLEDAAHAAISAFARRRCAPVQRLIRRTEPSGLRRRLVATASGKTFCVMSCTTSRRLP